MFVSKTAMEKRRIASGIMAHCYQRTVNGGLLFYSVSDHLVYYTSYCLLAEKYGIKIYGTCQMPDHVHDSLAAESLECLSSFKRDLNSLFAKRQNEWCSQSGPLFENPYGSAVKIGAKNARTNLIYVGNNPVERQLVKRAELYRWNYIAYAVSDHPFSDRLVKRNVSWALRNSLREVEIQRERCLPLTYPLLGRISRKLDINEKRQLTDFIVKTYNVIDYDAALSFFDGSYDKYLVALHSTTGSEYDLNEISVGRSDRCYAQMTSLLLKEYGISDIHDILRMKDRTEVFNRLRSKTDISPRQIRKYLRLP